MQLQIVIQLTAEPGKPGGRKPEDRRRESRICIRHESGTGSKDSIQPVAVNIQDVALIDGQLLIEQLMHMVRRNDDQRSFRNTETVSSKRTSGRSDIVRYISRALCVCGLAGEEVPLLR